MTIDLLQAGIEQGNIGSSGNTSSTKYLRTVEYIPYLYGLNNTIIINAISSNSSKTVQCYLMGYVSNVTNTRLFNQGAYAVPHEFDVSEYPTVKFVRITIRYSDSSVITPEELTSCTLSYGYIPPWTMEGDTPTPTDSLPIISTGFTKPYPASLWRIDENNDGYPYNELMPDILYVEPTPAPPPGIPIIQTNPTVEITDQSSVEYQRYLNGYTNPNLYRFRDGDLPEDTKCEVAIKGTNSYRFTEMPDYEDHSTESEIP